MNNVNTNTDAGFASSKPKIRFTPRELIHRHMENPDEPITDADIENLYLGDNESDILAAERYKKSNAFADSRKVATKN